MAEQETPVTGQTTVGDPPQEDNKDPKKVAPSEEPEKVEKREPGANEQIPEVDLKDVSVAEDGRIAIKVGRSTYYGKDLDEAWDAMLKGVQEKDEAFVKLQEKERKAKAESSIREPEEDGDEPELPPAPQVEKYVRDVFTERGLDVKMLSYTEVQWDELQEKDGLKDRHIVKIQSDIENAKAEATRRFYADETKWYNLSLMKRDITPAVRDMVANSGLEPDEFGDVYATLLKDPSMRFKSGELNATAILLAMSKKIVEKLKAEGAGSTELSKEKERLKKELDEKKKNLQDGSSRTNQKPKPHDKPIKDLKDAFDPERWKNVLAEP